MTQVSPVVSTQYGGKKTEKDLTADEVKRMLEAARQTSPGDSYAYLADIRALALKVLTVLDLRRSELVGQDDKRIPVEKRIPGLLIEDLRDDGIWVRRKKHKDKQFIPMLPEMVFELRKIIGKKTSGRIFPFHTESIWDWTRKAAERAGIDDAKLVHPHRLRHFTTSETGEKYGVTVARDVAGHASITTTNRYLRKTKPEKLLEAQRAIQEKVVIL